MTNDTKKSRLRRLAVSVAAALVMLYPAVYFLSAPRLGPHYDFLMKLRPLEPRPGAGRLLNRNAKSGGLLYPEILLIETGGNGNAGGDLIAASTVFIIMMTLSEMNAGALLIETPVLGVSSGRAVSETELVYRFDEEFNIVESNIKNLFDGIRLGSIAPLDAARYVNDVIKLTEQGKIRLLSAAARGDEEQAAQLENAAAVFGSVYIPGDILVDVIQPENDTPPPINRLYFPVYSRPPPDKDGKIRRIPPILSAANGTEYEYAVYSAIKKRFSTAEINAADGGFTLTLANASDEKRFILDRTASLLFGIPEGGGGAFRKIELALFLDYAETDKMLYRLLAESPTLAEYADIALENYPPFLYEQAQLVRDTLLENPGQELHERWLRLRAAYYDSLDSFFDKNDGAESKIISSFQNLKEQENLDDAGKERLYNLRNEQLEMIFTARDLYRNISTLRKQLKNELYESFCILGPVSRDTELSAMFANSIMTGYYTIPANIKQILFSSLFVILLLLCAMNKMKAVFSFCFCILMTAFIIAAFSYIFIVSGLWIDPLIPGAAFAAGSLASSLFAFFIKKQSEIKLRCVCGAIVSDAYLKKILQSGVSLEKEISAKAAIVTIIRPDIAIIENEPDAQKYADMLKNYHNNICSEFIKAGAVIISCDKNTVSAAFGSPLECIAAQKTQAEINPVNRAVTAVKALFKDQTDADKLYAGIGYGECVFSYSPLTGYTAAGSAVFRSHILSTAARRGSVPALISKTASEQAPMLFRGRQPFNTLNGEFASAEPDSAPEAGGAESDLCYQLILQR
ncbi:MAG: hypothetical protein LBK66_08565 [Spirochaetaceae bacterium]|nr:hypothetical protein [Spirochaetaceae bacterium]